MTYTTFNQTPNNALLEPMFLGNSVNVSRYDQQRYVAFEKLIEKQLSFFWRPEEVDVSKDRSDWQGLTDSEKHIFISNLKYQTLLDSMAARSVNAMLLPLVSLPEVETWVETWAFSETIHSRSYTHIIRNIMINPSEVFDDIVDNPEIRKRAIGLANHYDEFIELQGYYNLLGEGKHTITTNGESKVVDVSLRELKKKLYLCIVAVNVLEAIRFYVSFACSFSFAERKLMEGNAKIIKLIARDEALHLTGTQYIINLFKNGAEGSEMKDIAKECEKDAINIFLEAAQEEKEWAKYLFKDGSMIGLNENILCSYVEYITDQRLIAIGLKAHFGVSSNPIPWINSWLTSSNVQVAPQETEISSYLVGQIDSDVSDDDFSDMEL